METRPSVSFLAWSGLLASAAAALAVFLSGPGTRLSAWDFATGLRILRWGACGGAVGAVLSFLGAASARPGSGRRGWVPGLAGIAVGAITFAIPAGWYERAMTVPAIHDITTDTSDPPSLVALLPLRAGSPNPAGYGGSEVAAKQRSAYPDIRTRHSELPAPELFPKVLDAARAMGWEIVRADGEAGRVEAVATTRWFGFRDDVVVRVLPDPSGGCRVDVRSVSRVGKSDVGTNAQRIRAFLARLPASAVG